MNFIFEYEAKRFAVIFIRIVLIACLITIHPLYAEASEWQPQPSGIVQKPIWPDKPPDSKPLDEPETLTTGENLVAGLPWAAVTNVSKPTMTIYPPKGKNTGVTLVIFPGGGYRVLAIDLEGTEIADYFTARGITCVLLKYRVPYSGSYWDVKNNRRVIPKISTALEDAQRTIGLLRRNASEFHIVPSKIGVIGFSAGAHLAAALSTHFEKRIYKPVDDIDQESCRPDFAIIVYPGHMLENAAREFGLNPAIPVTQSTPPTFLLHAQNDPVDDVKNSLAYFAALKNAKVPCEMHIYADGGHAFGLRGSKYPITGWPDLVEKWFVTIAIK